MIIFLYGPDSYRRQQKQKEIAAEYQKKHSALTVERFYLDEAGDWQRFRDFVLNQSLFGGCRLAVMSHLVAEKELVKILKNNLETKNLILLISADDRPAKEWEFLLSEPALSQLFGHLTLKGLNNFILEESKRRGLRLRQSVIGRLAAVYRNDSWGLVTEIDKLALGGRPPANFPRINLWPALKKINLPFMERLLIQEDPAKIFNLLAYQAPPRDKIRLADYDVLVKSGKLDYEEALTDFLIS